MKSVELKPFCVKSEYLTDEELNTMLERCVELGATTGDWIKGFNKPSVFLFAKDTLPYWGVDKDLETYTTDRKYYHEDPLMTKEDAFDMLGIEIDETDITENILQPFCVRSKDLTDEELNTILEKCVELGAKKYDWVEGWSGDCGICLYDRDFYSFWGVSHEGATAGYSHIDPYNDNLLTKEQAFKVLRIETQDSTIEEVPVHRSECVRSCSQGFTDKPDTIHQDEIKTLSEAVHAHSGDVLIIKEGKVVLTTEELGEVTLESTDAFIKFVNMVNKLRG